MTAEQILEKQRYFLVLFVNYIPYIPNIYNIIEPRALACVHARKNGRCPYRRRMDDHGALTCW